MQLRKGRVNNVRFAFFSFVDILVADAERGPAATTMASALFAGCDLACFVRAPSTLICMSNPLALDQRSAGDLCFNGAYNKCGRNAGGLGAGIRAVRAPGDFDFGITTRFMYVFVWHLIGYLHR